MKIGLLSDIHGNALALKACLHRLEEFSVDAVYFLGDAVGYLPAAREVLERLKQSDIHCQQGNHEQMLLAPGQVSPDKEAMYRLQPARAQLSHAHICQLQSWPNFQEFRWRNRSLLLVHGSPRAPVDGYVYPDTDLSEFYGLEYDAVVMGHTHRPFVRHCGGKLFINVGSVGLPRDQGNLASFGVYDADRHAIDIVRVPLDADAIVAAYGDQIDPRVRACLGRPVEKGLRYA